MRLSRLSDKIKGRFDVYARLWSRCVVVYQMGRVGSTSLESSIENSYHVHNLYCDTILNTRTRLGSPCLVAVARYLDRALVRGIILLRRNRIVCPVRKPTDRAISMFFQMLPLHMYLYFRDQGSSELRGESMDSLAKAFWYSGQLDYPEKWVKNELLKLLKLEYEQVCSLRDSGFVKLKGRRNEVFIFKIEKANEVNSELSSFVGREINLSSVNSVKTKWSKGLYEQFKTDERLMSRIVEYGRDLKFASDMGYSD